MLFDLGDFGEIAQLSKNFEHDHPLYRERRVHTFLFRNHHQRARLANARTTTATTGPATMPALTPLDDELDSSLSIH